MRPTFTLLVSLAFYANLLGGELSAAEIDVVAGLDPSQNTILVRGPIEEGDDSRFFEVAEAMPRAIVYLESPGGLVTTGLSIAAEIAIRDYDTLVLDGTGCHSICAIIWVAGTRRFMSPDAEISVHAAYRLTADTNGDLESSESGIANAQIGAFLNEIDLSYEAISYFTFAGPGEELLAVTPDIAQALSIDVYIQTPTRTIPPAERPTPRRITRQVSEYSGLAGNCPKLLQVDADVWKDQSRIVLAQGHKIFGGQVFAPLLGEYVDVTKAAIKDLGFVRWCLNSEQNLRGEGLPTGILGPSYNCSKSSTPTELAICSSPDLWAMDRAMAGLYVYYRENTDEYRSDEFLASQRSWLSRRDQCSDDLACIHERYFSRLLDFGA